jgi:hypothetical protein
MEVRGISGNRRHARRMVEMHLERLKTRKWIWNAAFIAFGK